MWEFSGPCQGFPIRGTCRPTTGGTSPVMRGYKEILSQLSEKISEIKI